MSRPVVQLSCYTKHHRKGNTFVMNTVTQTMRFRQSLLSYAEKHGVTKAAIKYNVNRQYIYRWKRRDNGDIQSFETIPIIV